MTCGFGTHAAARTGSGALPQIGPMSHPAICSSGLAMAICVPFGFLNLEENMWFQVRHT